MMKDALHQEGIKVHCFGQPEKGLRFIRKNRPQIVMTDLVMPIVDGIKTLEHIMAFDPTIDVILMTV